MLQGATLLANVLVANILGTGGFGAYSFMQSTLNTWALVAQASSGIMATRYVAAFRRTDPQRAGRVIGFCGVLTATLGCTTAAILLLVRNEFASDAADAHSIAFGLMIVAFALPFASFALFHNGVLAGLERFKHQAGLASGSAIIFIIFPVVGASAVGMHGAVAGLLCAFVVRFFVYRLAIRRDSATDGIYPIFRGAFEIWSLLRHFAVPAAITSIVSAGGMWVGNLLVLRQPNGPHYLGLLSAAMAFRMLVIFVPAQLGTVALSALTRHAVTGGVTKFRRLLTLVAIMTTFTAGFAALVPRNACAMVAAIIRGWISGSVAHS